MSYIPGSTDPATNSRFTDLGANTNSEMIAAVVDVQYDPANPALCVANFNGHQYVSIANTYHALSQSVDILHVDFAEKMETCYGNTSGSTLTDPVTGADLTKISVAGIMMLFKTAYDQEYNAQHAP